VLHVHSATEEVTFSALLHKLEKGTGRKSKKPPGFATKGMSIIARLEVTSGSGNICVERFEDCKYYHHLFKQNMLIICPSRSTVGSLYTQRSGPNDRDWQDHKADYRYSRFQRSLKQRKDIAEPILASLSMMACSCTIPFSLKEVLLS
jgi:Elongation factor Tu C-terminal domain